MKAVGWLVGAVVALLLVFALIGRLQPAPHGPVSSSYATSPRGLAAYADVLRRTGHRVRQLRVPVDTTAPAAGDTLVVLDPSVIEPGESRAIARWVRSGGRLVAGGLVNSDWLEIVLHAPPELKGGADVKRRPLVPLAGVGTVESADGGAWRKLGSALPVVGPADAPLLASRRLGRGQVLLLADASPLQNGGLDSADNAAFGVALAGGRPVDFLETVHGYGAARGLGGLPTRGKWVLIGLLLAALIGVWSAGRRFGPPEEPERPLPPPRVEYVDALAAALSRTKEEP